MTKGDAMHHTDGVIDGSRIVARVMAAEGDGQPVPIGTRKPRLCTRLEAWAKLLLHGKVGERHPLRRVAQAVARLGRRGP